MVRAKFQLSEIHNMAWSDTSKRFIFMPQYDPSIPEDVRFAETSPSGKFEMQVDNSAAIEQLKLGQQYYVDFTPVPTAG